MTPVESSLTADDMIPLRLFGKDHWSVLAYIETYIVDHRTFPVIGNPRMRANRRNSRVLRSHPNCIVMKPEQGSRLSDGTYVSRHDDWCCVQDLIATGFLKSDRSDGEMDVDAEITMTDLGRATVVLIRQFKADGGTLATFVLPEAASPSLPSTERAA